MTLFAEPDQSQLVGPPTLFDGAALKAEHGDWLTDARVRCERCRRCRDTFLTSRYLLQDIV